MWVMEQFHADGFGSSPRGAEEPAMRRARLLSILAAVLLPAAACHEGGSAPSGSAKATVSSPGAYGQEVEARPAGGTVGVDLTVDEATTDQAIDGFGGAFNEQGWDALAVLDEGERQEALRLLFAADGARFRFGRLPIGASDYAMDRYTLDDVPGDYAMEQFSIERDRARLIPYTRAALAVQPALRLWASAWTPPPWLKTNGAYDSGAMRDDAAALAAYALYLARFVESYRGDGLTIGAVHVQNEPAQLTRYPSCLWTPELIRDFVRDHLGPAFAARQVTAEIWLGTLNTADPRYAHVVLADPGARRHVRGIGVQWGALAITADLAAAYPTLPLMQTETVCGNHPWEAGFDPNRPPNDHAYGERTWGRIRDYLRAGVRSYMAWNMVLDTEGKNLDSERPWPQNALLVVDRQARRLVVTAAYWAFRHFSGFVDAGAVRVGVTGTHDDAVAFRNPDGRLVVVLQNAGSEPKTLVLAVRSERLEIDLPPHGWATLTR
jgi:glucosylceramidase